MNLASTVSIYGGGPGSGCRGSNCGRPSTGGKKEGFDVFYHGTVLASAKKMLKEGLTAKSEKAFKTDRIPTSRGYVYVSKDKNLAKSFAAIRASYDQTPPGDSYAFPFFYKPSDYDSRLVGHKRDEGQPASFKDEVPAIVELHIPKKVAEKFEKDPDWNPNEKDDVALIHKGIIPKKYIKSVEVMQEKGDNWEFKDSYHWKPLSKKELAASKSGVTLYLVYYGPLDALKRHLNAGA